MFRQAQHDRVFVPLLLVALSLSKGLLFLPGKRVPHSKQYLNHGITNTVDFYGDRKCSGIIKFAGIKNSLPMSLLNNSNKKGQKKNQQQKNSPIPSVKGKANTKAIQKNTKLTGGSQRGS
jgi:hypothetical protein